ncbi:MAG: hypothetical protein ACI4V7_08270 [Succinivibrionaceae bacterium]
MQIKSLVTAVMVAMGGSCILTSSVVNAVEQQTTKDKYSVKASNKQNRVQKDSKVQLFDVDLMDQFSVEFIDPMVANDLSQENEEPTTIVLTEEVVQEPIIDNEAVSNDNTLSQDPISEVAKVELKEEKVSEKETVKEIAEKTPDQIAVVSNASKEIDEEKVEQPIVQTETLPEKKEVQIAETSDKKEHDLDVAKQKVDPNDKIVATVGDYIITESMLYSKELEEKYPMPKAFNEFKATEYKSVDMEANNGYFVVPKGIGTQKLLKEIYTEEMRNAGLTTYQLLIALYRKNSSKFGATLPLFPYAEAKLAIPTIEQISLEKRDSYKELFSQSAGTKISVDTLPKISKSIEEQKAEYDELMVAYNERKLKVLAERTQYLVARELLKNGNSSAHEKKKTK